LENLCGGSPLKIRFFWKNRRPEKFSKKIFFENIFFGISDPKSFRKQKVALRKVLLFGFYELLKISKLRFVKIFSPLYFKEG